MNKAKNFFQTHGLSLVIILLTSVFSSGATYSSIRYEIQSNTDKIQENKATIETNRKDVNDRLDRIEDQVGGVRDKLDQIEVYLRDENSAWNRAHATYDRDVDTYQKEHKEYLRLTAAQKATAKK